MVTRMTAGETATCPSPSEQRREGGETASARGEEEQGKGDGDEAVWAREAGWGVGREVGRDRGKAARVGCCAGTATGLQVRVFFLSLTLLFLF